MNVRGKGRFYAECARVLRPGGQLVFNDIFLGAGGSVRYPVPWAETEAISHLWSPEEVQRSLQGLGLELLEWTDTSDLALDWFQGPSSCSASTPGELGLHLLLGGTAADKWVNMVHNLREAHIATVQAVLRKPDD